MMQDRAMQEITVNDLVIEVIRKKIKNLYLTVCPPFGTIRISTPLKMKEETVHLFIMSKLTWIRKQKAKFTLQEHHPVAIHYLSGETHFLLGQRYTLKIVHTEKKSKILLNEDFTIELHIDKNSTLAQRSKTMTQWYRKEMKKTIIPLVEKWEGLMGVKALEWKIRLMKSRWGSCNINEKRILLNLELIKKPLHCLEYVIVHELVHLFERKHNKRFKAYMDKFMPAWRFYKAELNGNKDA